MPGSSSTGTSTPAAVSGGFSSFRRKWVAFAEKLAEFNARILLTFIYIVVFVPAGLILRLVADPLRLSRKPESESYFLPREQANDTLEDWRRQY